MVRVLVTGVNGFVGIHLVRELRNRHIEVIGVGHGVPPRNDIAPLLADYYSCDLTQAEQVANLPLQDFDAVINLAGLANVGASFSEPDRYKYINVAVFSTLAEAILARKSPARVIAVSTGAVYTAHQPMPLTENSQVTTNGSPYAMSKLSMERVVKDLQAKGLDCIIVRPFNHFGPGQMQGFLVPDLLAKIKQSVASDLPMKVGNLMTKRDYTDVRDIVRAYVDLALSEDLDFTIYNICSSESRSGESILHTLLTEMGLVGKIPTEVAKSLIRKDDPIDLFGSHQRITNQTGWQPIISFEQTIKDIIETQK